MYYAIVEVGILNTLLQVCSLFILRFRVSSLYLSGDPVMRSSTFPVWEVETGLEKETTDEESHWYRLLRPMPLTGRSASSLAYGDPVVDQSPLDDGPECLYSVAITCVLWSSQGLVPNCLFKEDAKA